MKKTIAIVLAVVFVAGGLGGFVYAQGPNQVWARFCTELNYEVLGDTFINSELTTGQEWRTIIQNEWDETGAPVTAVELSLDSTLEFDRVEEENLTTMGPPSYEWSFGDVPQDSEVGADVRSEAFPVTWTPGFDASRSADKTEFTAPDTQTLTITVTPRQVLEGFGIGVDAEENELVNPVITSPTTNATQGIELSPDGHWLRMWPTGLSVNTTSTYYVTIEVTPKVPEVEYMPGVEISWGETLDSGTTSGSSINHTAGDPADNVGTWTWTATGSYEWNWTEDVRREITFEEYLGNHVRARFSNERVYDSLGDTFINGEVTGGKFCKVQMENSPDGTGAPVTALALSLDSELTFDGVEVENLTTMGPPSYVWSFGDVAEGSEAWTGVGLDSAVTFTPGFDASRLADKTVFLQSDGTQTQTLTITVTPRDTTEGFCISVGTWENELVNPVIISPTTGEGIELSPDGHWLDIHPEGLSVNITSTYYVTIEVTPKVPEVEYMPYVDVKWDERLAEGITSGSSVSYPAGEPGDEVGTWTWSAQGSYAWFWNEDLQRRVCFERIVETVPSEPVTEPKKVKKDAIVWVGQAEWSAEMPQVAVMQRICERITTASNGRFQLTVWPTGGICPEGEEFDRVHAGTIDFAFGNPSNWGEQFFPAYQLFSPSSGGMLTKQKQLWFTSGGGVELAQEMIDGYNKESCDYNVHIIPSGAYFFHTPEIFLHSKVALNEPDDLKGLNIRATPDGQQILNLMGANAFYLPGGDAVYWAMKNPGLLDACEWATPYDNWGAKFQEVAQYVYVSGCRHNTIPQYFIVNQARWDELPDDLKVIVQEVTEEEALRFFEERCQLDIEALANFRDYGNTVEMLSLDIEAAFIKTAKAYHDGVAADELALGDDLYAKVLRSLRAFEAMQGYAELCE